MKTFRLLCLAFITTSIALAEPIFPGLKAVMTDAEWNRAGLDKLSPDQIGVIDAALIKYHIQTARRSATVVADAAPISSPTPAPGATAAEVAAAKSRFWEKFGFGKSSSSSDWRSQPPMTAKVTGWRGANGFVLDNGQIWEGLEKIPFDLPGNSVIIEARPLDAFALKLSDDSVAVRVRRVK